jgi:hypothetical protein
MYDTATHSLWNQFTGRPVVGPLTGSGIVLKTRPVVIASWADWRARYRGSKVLALDTGGLCLRAALVRGREGLAPDAVRGEVP